MRDDADDADDAIMHTAFQTACCAVPILSLADIVSTSFGISQAHVYEVNRLISAMLQHGGIFTFSLFKVMTTGAIVGMLWIANRWLHGHWRWVAIGAAIVVDAFMLAVVIENILLVVH